MQQQGNQKGELLFIFYINIVFLFVDLIYFAFPDSLFWLELSLQISLRGVHEERSSRACFVSGWGFLFVTHSQGIGDRTVTIIGCIIIHALNWMQCYLEYMYSIIFIYIRSASLLKHILCNMYRPEVNGLYKLLFWYSLSLTRRGTLSLLVCPLEEEDFPFGPSHLTILLSHCEG